MYAQYGWCLGCCTFDFRHIEILKQADTTNQLSSTILDWFWKLVVLYYSLPYMVLIYLLCIWYYVILLVWLHYVQWVNMVIILFITLSMTVCFSLSYNGYLQLTLCHFHCLGLAFICYLPVRKFCFIFYFRFLFHSILLVICYFSYYCSALLLFWY
jgi:hypothetical protein